MSLYVAGDMAPLERGRDLERRSRCVGVVGWDGILERPGVDGGPGDACFRKRCFISSMASAVGCRDTGLPYRGLPLPVSLDEMGEPSLLSGSGDMSRL